MGVRGVVFNKHLYTGFLFIEMPCQLQGRMQTSSKESYILAEREQTRRKDADRRVTSNTKPRGHCRLRATTGQSSGGSSLHVRAEAQQALHCI